MNTFRKALIPGLAFALLAFACGPGTTGTPGGTASPAALASPTGTAGASPSATGSPGASPTGTGASPTGSPTASPTASAMATASPTGTATASPGTAGASGVCAMVDRSEVEALIGDLSTEPTALSLPLPGFTASTCVFASADGTLTIVTGPKGLSRSDFDTLARFTPGATEVSGIGESAFSIRAEVPQGMAGAAAILALDDGEYFTVQAAHRSKTSEQLRSGLTDIAKEIADR